MKKKFLFVLFFASVCIASAQEWQTDFTTAKQIAAKQDKPIILVFQGSDWCAPCIKLDKEVWSTPEFKSYAKDHFVMLQADFPRKKANALAPEQQEKNNQLAEKYNQNGYFPFVVILDENGKVLGETGYQKMQPNEYIKLLNSFKS
ncbi:thioredoxin family protein [Leeuwenhoekiella sp. A16]|uniref:thioredoxin family protein n=1 Tax=unclassified Leeuwenhoekiella TaxID=2615029 RepID=UPI003A80944C